MSYFGVSKHCETCSKRFSRRKSESNYAFGRRRFCSMKCDTTLYRRPNLDGYRELWERASR